MRFDTKILDEVVSKISSVIPDDIKSAKNSFEKNTRATLEGVFQRLDLVTREEFDVQTKLLSKSQQRVKELEQRVQELEEKLLKNK